MQVLGPKGPLVHGGLDQVTWAKRQLKVARDILDNPGGGLLFATQTIGQVHAALADDDPERWEKVTSLLQEAEDLAVRRRYQEARRKLDEAEAELPPE